jgi:hypothetical protein
MNLRKVKAGGETLCSEIHKIIRSVWNIGGPAPAVEGICYSINV